MGTVTVDADVVIGFLNRDDPQYASSVAMLRPWLGAEHTILVPASVYSEILVRPTRLGRDSEIEEFLTESRARVIAIGPAIARRAARLRAASDSLRLPDALALATALEHKATFLTLDHRLQRIAETSGD